MSDYVKSKQAGCVGLVKTKKAVLFSESESLLLESGRSLCFVEVAYETYGKLNAERDNAVLVCHALTGDAHVAGYHHEDDRKPGWWNDIVGPGKAIDTEKYFVVCSNVLGGCKGTTGPSSVNPETGKPWGLTFPVFTIEDIVKVQKQLVEHLGVDCLLGVVGGSLGGMQVLEWAIRYPDKVKAALAIATTTRLGAQSIAFDAVGRNAILADGGFQGGEYAGGEGPQRGLAIARMIGHITYLSEESMHLKFGRSLRHADQYRYDFDSEFSVETYLDYQGQSFVDRFDANSYLYLTKAMDYYDLAARFGSLEKAFAEVQADVMVMSFSSDWLFTPRQSRDIVDAMLSQGKRVTYCEVDSPYGHDAFLLEANVVGRLIGGFLKRAAEGSVPGIEEVHQPYRQDPAVDTPWTKMRVDYDRIEELIVPGSSVLDIGSGRGELLHRLIVRRGVVGLGVEVNQDDICNSVELGIPVVDLDVETELGSFGDGSFDYVVLSHTLQTLGRVEPVIEQMLRIGKKCIISFPNFAYWRPRLQMMLGGRTPVSASLPFEWHDTPNIRFVTISDFVRFCRRQGIEILQQIPMVTRDRAAVRLWPNLRAEEVIFVVSRAGIER